jgi:hypothetical protein
MAARLSAPGAQDDPRHRERGYPTGVAAEPDGVTTASCRVGGGSAGGTEMAS